MGSFFVKEPKEPINRNQSCSCTEHVFNCCKVQHFKSGDFLNSQARLWCPLEEVTFLGFLHGIIYLDHHKNTTVASVLEK